MLCFVVFGDFVFDTRGRRDYDVRADLTCFSTDITIWVGVRCLLRGGGGVRCDESGYKKRGRYPKRIPACCVKDCVYKYRYGAAETVMFIHSLSADPAEFVAVNLNPLLSTLVTVPLITPLLNDNPAGITPPLPAKLGLPVT